MSIDKKEILQVYEICWILDSSQNIGITEAEAYSILNLLDI